MGSFFSSDQLKQKLHVFLVGIGGIGMSALARILWARGHHVSGSDRSDSAILQDLRQKGMEVFVGHRAAHIHEDIDLVVYTNAVSIEDNPELIQAKQLGVPIIERAKLLNMLASSKYAIGVSGTHGKTTTTSMLAKIFLAADLDPSLAVGGVLSDIGGSGYDGKGKFFIYESCEAFESFLKLYPDTAVITNVDADHLDYYKTFDNVKKAFASYMQENVSPYGLLVYNRDNEPLREIVDRLRLPQVISVGIETPADFVAKNVELSEFSSRFVLMRGKEEIGTFYVNVPGLHNVYNALLATVTAKLHGVPQEVIYRTLSTFQNANRRFEVKYQSEDLVVIDDYAHHPSEVMATLKAARRLAEKNGAELVVVFQPHLYSRTLSFYREFAQALSLADRIILTEIYPAREVNPGNVSSELIYNEIVKMRGNSRLHYFESLEQVKKALPQIMSTQAVLVTLGAGDVWKISNTFSVA
ncbi:UDP-N-acetylmuramate--L-alanine ligase [Thermospira aquatica]|uniref:UDP-N-acetylmuramate--L-alanine ligase n=1 Tax=Thermospira aquatica TaxID=2828656 RepID=A0AAX3BB66_9SPIR|nr:UDP-N-acetylmuramate--L-alanine ligase [Thermospira aquatica]URA09505.1 UDP-N-acetylmuramate--L-alanine ligase [Thermospira aquatica]